MIGHRILLNPDNKLLGASSADFSLFGAQPSASDLAVHIAPADVPTAVEDQSAPALAPAVAPGGSELATTTAPGPTSADVPVLSTSTLVSTQPIHLLNPAAGSAPELPLAPATGTGSAAVVPPVFVIDSQASAAPASSDAPSGPLDALAGPVMAPAAAVDTSATITPLVATLASAASLGDVFAAAGQTLAAITGTLTTPLQPVSETAGAVSIHLAESVADAVATASEALSGTVQEASALTGTVTNTLAPVAEAVDLVAATTVATAAEVITPIAGTVGAAVGGFSVDATSVTALAADTLVQATASGVAPISAVATPVNVVVGAAPDVAGNAAAETAQAATDTLGDLAGSDPAGGVATLVDLVTTTDSFDVGAPDLSDSPDLAPTILDTLVADVPLEDSLLGADHGTHDLLGGGSDDHDQGLGLGL